MPTPKPRRKPARKDGVEEVKGADGKWYWRIRSKGRILDPRQRYSRRVDMRRALTSMFVHLGRYIERQERSK